MEMLEKGVKDELLNYMCMLYKDNEIQKYAQLDPMCKKMANIFKDEHISKEILRYTLAYIIAKLLDKNGIIKRYNKENYSNNSEKTSKLVIKTKQDTTSSANKIKKQKEKDTIEGSNKLVTTRLIEAVKDNKVKDGEYFEGIKVNVIKKELGVCRECGEALVSSGFKDYSAQIDIIPMEIKFNVYVEEIGKCVNKECLHQDIQRTKVESSCRNILSQQAVIEFILHKYLFQMPLYREENLKLPIRYETILNNVNRVGKRLADLAQAIEDSMFESKEVPILHIDETYINLTKTPNKKDNTKRSNSYVYILTDKRGIRFKATISRSAEWFKEKLNSLKYVFYIISDGYTGYEFINSDFHQLCLCHVRRLIYYVVLSIPEGVDIKQTASFDLLQSIDKVFMYEKEIKNLSDKERKKERNSFKYKAIIKEFKDKLKLYKKEAPKGTKIRQAIDYSLNNWDKLWTYTNEGYLECHNTNAELGARTFDLTRKDSMVFNNEDSAKIGCDLLTIIQTAKMNNIDVRKYLKYVLDNLGVIDVNDLLPWKVNI